MKRRNYGEKIVIAVSSVIPRYEIIIDANTSVPTKCLPPYLDI